MLATGFDLAREAKANIGDRPEVAAGKIMEMAKDARAIYDDAVALYTEYGGKSPVIESELTYNPVTGDFE